MVPTVRAAAPGPGDGRHRGAARPGPAEHQALLLDVTRAILEQDRDEAGLARLVFDLVAPHIDADIGFNYAAEADGLTLRLVAGPGIPEEFLPGCERLRVGQAFCGTAAASRLPFLADAARIAEDALAALPRAMGMRAYAGHPLLDRRGGLLGTLAFASTRRDRFSAGEIGLLRTLSDFVALTWQRHRAEAALRASEARFQALFESVPVPVAVVDPGTLRLVACNGRLCEMLGHGREALRGMALDSLDAGQDAEALRAALRAVVAGSGRSKLTRRVRRSDGALRSVSVSAEAVTMDGRRLVSETWLDITERLAAAAALRASEERLRSVIGTAADGIVVASAEGRILQANPAVLRMFGQAEAELLGQDLGILMPPDDAARHVDYLAACRGGPARVIGVPGRELLARRRDGSTFPVEVSVGSFEVGGECFLTGILRDVTERKRAEERQELLMREVNHRARNALAVVQATLRLTPKEDAATFARAVEGRVSALARAQGLLTREHWRGAELRALLQGELAPFMACGAGTAARGGTDLPPPTARLEGPSVWLQATATQPLAMAVHELATNAVKHGALSLPGGEVTVCWHLADGDDGRSVLRLRWAEAGGPAIAGPPTRRGFGSRVLEGTVRGQLGGAVSLDWAAAGLACAIEVPLGRTA
ncbi:PAS domain S-box protein [Roseicella aquatilis]|uniref:PAS domain S-box protein n=1 Tax=Roseicella aquatilis TaxID=2527868 RepID=UPI00140506AB|nr:PAS domain S-box protein [Roseicella aquatilis]